MNGLAAAEFWSLTFPSLMIAALAAASSALLGNFLVLRRQAMLADAVSHVVLPGIVVAFLVTGSMAAGPMGAGALIAALGSLALIELIRRRLSLDPGAAIGIVFTAMFALGVLLLEASQASRVHLDVEHALYGNLESLVWLSATSASALLDPAALADLPPALPRLAAILLIVLVSLVAVWRPLAIASFDPVYAEARGLPTRLIGLMLAAEVALVAVAAFEAVGSVLVIAMFVCPAASARLIADDLPRQVMLSLCYALAAAIGGVLIAGYLPGLLGLNFGVSAAGTIATLSGLMLMATAAARLRRGQLRLSR